MPVPLSGRYAAQGIQVRTGLLLWARWVGAHLVVEDDASRPERAVACYGRLLASCELVLGPYGSDSVRAVARAGIAAPLWNHGGAADDVQRLPGCRLCPVSGQLLPGGAGTGRQLPCCDRAAGSPSQRLEESSPGLPARGSRLRVGAGAALRGSPDAALRLAALEVFALDDPPERITAFKPDAVLLCGPLRQELSLLRALRGKVPLLGGVSPALRSFPTLFGGDPDGLLAPAQWHPALPGAAELGPSTAEVLDTARALGCPSPDYLAAQAFACALVASRCPRAHARRPATRSTAPLHHHLLRPLRARPGHTGPTRPPALRRALARLRAGASACRCRVRRASRPGPDSRAESHTRREYPLNGGPRWVEQPRARRAEATPALAGRGAAIGWSAARRRRAALLCDR